MKSREKEPTKKEKNIIEEEKMDPVEFRPRALEEIKKIKTKEEKAMEEDKFHPRAWKKINPDDLFVENLDLFSMAFLMPDGLLGANGQILKIGELLEQIKDGDVKDSNQGFFDIYNSLIQKKVEENGNR